MKIKPGTLYIFYNIYSIDSKMDKTLIKVLQELGYTCYATGFHLQTGTRDLAFERISQMECNVEGEKQ